MAGPTSFTPRWYRLARFAVTALRWAVTHPEETSYLVKLLWDFIQPIVS